jgi:hypothetical protein
MLRRNILIFLLLGGACLFAAAAEKNSNDPAFSQISSIVQCLSRISGLTETHPIPVGRMRKPQLHRFLAKRIKKSIRPEEIRADEIALKMFGLVPRDFNLKKWTIDLLTEQAAAFYDYESKKLYLLDGVSPDEQTATLAHELAHALADQHFDLSRFMDVSPSNDDEDLAHSAVVEGQASWLMLAYSLQSAGSPPDPTPQMIQSALASDDDSEAAYPVLRKSPLYIRESLMFPYVNGALFFNSVFHQMGKRAFSAVFTNPPVDSAQIMHPEKYFRHDAPAHPALPQVDLPRGGAELAEGAFGEFDHDILLRQYVGAAQAASLSPHLLGGDFKIVSGGPRAGPVLEYASAWDSQANASHFFADYRRILQAKSERCIAEVSNGSVFAGQTSSGFFIVRLQGNAVTSIEGLSDKGLWNGLLQTHLEVASVGHGSSASR